MIAQLLVVMWNSQVWQQIAMLLEWFFSVLPIQGALIGALSSNKFLAVVLATSYLPIKLSAEIMLVCAGCWLRLQLEFLTIPGSID